MDLLKNVAQDLGFEFHLYIVQDGLFGSKILEHKPDELFRYFNQDEYHRKKGIVLSIQLIFPKSKLYFSAFCFSFKTDVTREFRIFKENDDIHDKTFYFQQEKEKYYEFNEVNSHDRKIHERREMKTKWNGIVGDLVAGVADMTFAPLSISK